MPRFAAVLGLVILMTGCASQSLPQRHQVLVVAIDKQATFSIGGLNDAVAGPIADAGFDTYDQSLLSIDDFNPKLGLHSRPSVLELARASHSVPLDYLVYVTVEPIVVEKLYSQRVIASVSARLIAVGSGRTLKSLTQKGRVLNVSPSCRDTCMRQKIIESSLAAGRDIGYFLADYLAQTGGGHRVKVASENKGGDQKKVAAQKKIGISPKGTTGW